ARIDGGPVPHVRPRRTRTPARPVPAVPRYAPFSVRRHSTHFRACRAARPHARIVPDHTQVDQVAPSSRSQGSEFPLGPHFPHRPGGRTMRHPCYGRLRRQVDRIRQSFLQEGNLPFTAILTEEGLSEALETIQVAWNNRIFTPLVTLWVFLGQVLSADPS